MSAESSVHFSSVPCGSSVGHERRFSGDPLPVSSTKVLVGSSCMGRDVHSLILSSISSADHDVIHHQKCPEGCLWRGCRGVWHAQTMQVFVSWQLSEKVPVDPQGSWSCSACLPNYIMSIPLWPVNAVFPFGIPGPSALWTSSFAKPCRSTFHLQPLQNVCMHCYIVPSPPQPAHMMRWWQ